MRHVIVIYFLRRSSLGGLPDFLFLFSFPCSAGHERDWPPCKVVFLVGNNTKADREKKSLNFFLSSIELLGSSRLLLY